MKVAAGADMGGLVARLQREKLADDADAEKLEAIAAKAARPAERVRRRLQEQWMAAVLGARAALDLRRRVAVGRSHHSQATLMQRVYRGGKSREMQQLNREFMATVLKVLTAVLGISPSSTYSRLLD